MFGLELPGIGYLSTVVGLSVGGLVLDIIFKFVDKPELGKLCEKVIIVVCMGLIFKFFVFDVLQEIMSAFLGNTAPNLHDWIYTDWGNE